VLRVFLDAELYVFVEQDDGVLELVVDCVDAVHQIFMVLLACFDLVQALKLMLTYFVFQLGQDFLSVHVNLLGNEQLGLFLNTVPDHF